MAEPAASDPQGDADAGGELFNVTGIRFAQVCTLKGARIEFRAAARNGTGRLSQMGQAFLPL
jgi:hypothetical protein